MLIVYSFVVVFFPSPLCEPCCTHLPFQFCRCRCCFLQVYSRVSDANGFIQEGICRLTALAEPTFCAELDLSEYPTMAPTVTPDAPDNNICSAATTIL